MKIAILGSSDAVQGFRAVGVEAAAVSTNDEAELKLQQFYDSPDFAVVFITEDWFDRITPFIKQLPPKALPAIVAVPSQAGSTGAGLANLKRIVEQAVGSDILAER